MLAVTRSHQIPKLAWPRVIGTQLHESEIKDS
jgi:hypothetical protein